jgi:hypothetical protein
MMHGSAQWVLTKLHRQNSGWIAGRCCNFARPCQKAFLRLEIKQLPGRALGVLTLTGQSQLETFGSALNFDATPLPARLHQVADETPKAWFGDIAKRDGLPRQR